MINAVLYQTEGVIFTSTPLTLGYGIEQTVPARYVICSPSTQDITVILPAILAEPNFGEYTPGSGPGFAITLINLSASHSVIIEPADEDILVNIPNLTAQNSSISIFSASNGAWYLDNNSGSAAGNPAGSNTQIQYNAGGLFGASAALRFIPGIGFVTTLPIFCSANTAPLDGDIANSEVAMWFDPTNGSPSVNFKGKQADGTIVTATVLMS